MEIDPYNLGQPVYKEDQVLTTEDLRKIINELVASTADEILTSTEAERFDAALGTLTNLYDWVKLGKPTEMPPLED